MWLIATYGQRRGSIIELWTIHDLTHFCPKPFAWPAAFHSAAAPVRLQGCDNILTQFYIRTYAHKRLSNRPHCRQPLLLRTSLHPNKILIICSHHLKFQQNWPTGGRAIGHEVGATTILARSEPLFPQCCFGPSIGRKHPLPDTVIHAQARHRLIWYLSIKANTDISIHGPQFLWNLISNKHTV